MQENLDDVGEFAVHFVLATIPQGQEKAFDTSIRKDFYEEYRSDKMKYSKQDDFNNKYWYEGDDLNTPVLYNPLRYFILGNYDIAYISLIDSFKFAHRLFEPQLRTTPCLDSPEVYNPHTFQSFTGISHEKGESLKSFFYGHLKNIDSVKKYFLGICNLKLNNGLLIGNGMNYIKSSKDLICSIIEKINLPRAKSNKIEFLIIQSFSWFEISLLVFTDNPDDIKDIIVELRRSQINNFPNSKELIANSLYNAVLEPSEKINICNSNVFADTHTYIGLHADLITNPNLNDPFIVEFLAKNIELQTEIEWQVKPGHMHLLAHVIRENIDLKDIFNLGSRYMVTGKSDYLLKENSNKINNNFYLLRHIISDDCKLFAHVRKIRTKVLFDASNFNSLPNRPVISFSDKLKSLAIKREEITKVDKNLKSLKVSRQIRIKILKIFSNFNNGIQDIILFPYFLDFKIFVTNLIHLIEEEKINWDKSSKSNVPNFATNELSVHSLEKILSKWLEVFQEGYGIRLLNGYQFEDIIDFDLDFNSSIQQLLTAYGTISYEIGNLIYEKVDQKEGKRNAEYYPIVQLNYKDTVANYLSINYAVHHLTSPEFVYATLSKEILNSLKSDSARFKKIMQLYKKELQSISENINKKIFEDMKSSNLIDPEYYFNDAIRFVTTYNMNFDLYYYWFWNYNFQNSSLYDKSGLFNEYHFRKELFRVLILMKIFNYQGKLECPLPEIYTYWNRHFDALDELSELYIKQLESKNILSKIFTSLSEIIDSTLIHSNINGSDEIEANRIAMEKLSKIKARGNEYSNAEFPKRLLRKFYIFQYLDNFPNSDIVQLDSLIYLQWKMYDYLRTIYEMNSKVVSILRRNWADGTPLISFVRANKSKHLYSVDQTGGLFFDDMNSLNSYFKISSHNIIFVLNYSLIHKRNFIVEKLKRK